MNVQEAAEELGVRPKTVYDLVQTGRLPARKSRGRIVIAPEAVEQRKHALAGDGRSGVAEKTANDIFHEEGVPTDLLGLLRTGSTLRDAAAAVRMPWDQFAARYNADNEFRQDVEQAQSICRNALRAAAASKAGTRAASDALKLVAHLEREEPVEELRPRDEFEHLWAAALTDDQRERLREIVASYPVDAPALVVSAGDWTEEGSLRAAENHQERAAAP